MLFLMQLAKFLKLLYNYINTKIGSFRGKVDYDEKIF